MNTTKKLVVASLALAFVGGGEALLRMHTHSQLEAQSAEARVPLVRTVHPQAALRAAQLVLPGEVRAFVDAPIYSRTTGYVKRWVVDLGAHVKAGQLLAELDTPEVDAQLRQAEADLAMADANLSLARTTHERWQQLLAIQAVSQQNYEDKAGDLRVKMATREAAAANVARYRQLQDFKHVVAPFDGVITARNVDTGDLVHAETGTAGTSERELFHLVDSSRLRVFVEVPQAQSNQVQVGQQTELTFPEQPGKHFHGSVVHTAGAVNPDTRTLRVEADVDNVDAALFGGAYAEVTFNMTPVDPVLLPVNTLLFRSDGLRVAIVTPAHTVRLIPISIGKDFGTEVEVVEGIKGDEQLILNPPDSIQEGDRVRLPGATAESFLANTHAPS